MSSFLPQALITSSAPPPPTSRNLPDERLFPPWEHKRIDSASDIPLIDLPRFNEPLFGLTNRYHAIWRWAAWRNYAWDDIVEESRMDSPQTNFSQATHRRLQPAIQLATILLHRAYPILVRIVRGPLSTDANGKPIFDPQWTPQRSDYDALFRELAGFCRDYRILRYAPQVPPECTTLGITGDLFNNECLADQSRRPRLIVSALASETLNEIEDDNLWWMKSDEEKASTMIGLAQTLLHELAHALYCRRHAMNEPWFNPFLDAYMDWARGLAGPGDRMNASSLEIEEPIVYPENYQELGWSVTTYVFGGELAWPYRLTLNRWDILAGRDAAKRADASGRSGLRMDIFPKQDRTGPVYEYDVPSRLLPMFFKDRFWAREKTLIYLTDNADGSDWSGSSPRTHDPPHPPVITSPQQMLTMIQNFNRTNPLGLQHTLTVEEILHRLQQLVRARGSPL